MPAGAGAAYEETGAVLNDGTCKIFLSTKGTNGADVPQELIHFLEYVENSTEECAEGSHDEKIQALHRKVAALKKSRKLEEAYMTMEELLADREAAGKAAGEAIGEARGQAAGEARGQVIGQELMLELVSRMAADGLAGEIPKLKEDADFRESMFKKYQLK